jgi:SAM-dependent methyltransferase
MVNAQRGRFYDEDLAYIHDAGFGEIARAAAGSVLEFLKQRNINDGLVVDLGCGSGIVAELMTDAGFDVLGIDNSTAMLTIARKRAPGAQFRKASLFELKLPRCVAVTAIGEAINYRTDEHRVRDPARLFRRVWKALCGGCIFVLDVAGPGRGSQNQHIHAAGADWAILVDKSEENQLLKRSMTIFRKTGKVYRRSEETHFLRLYAPDAVRADLERAGFRVKRLRAYGNLRFGAGHAGFLALKN